MIIKNHLVQAYKQAPWRIRTQKSTFFLVGIILAACMVWVMETISIQATNAGLEIQAMTVAELNLKRELADLRLQGADSIAADKMEKRAQDMGFRPATREDLTYVTGKGYPGRQSRISAPPPSSDLPPVLIKPSYTQSLSEWLWKSAIKLSEQTGKVKP